MSITDKASSFFSGLVDAPELKKIRKAKKPKVKGKEFIVYFVNEKPDCVWMYDHNPSDGICYGKLQGYFEEDKEAKIARHYVQNESTNLKLMSFQKFMDQVVPNKDCTKIYETEEDFLLDLL